MYRPTLKCMTEMTPHNNHSMLSREHHRQTTEGAPHERQPCNERLVHVVHGSSGVPTMPEGGQQW